MCCTRDARPSEALLETEARTRVALDRSKGIDDTIVQ